MINKNNKTNIRGNDNIIIQDVEANNITIIVNGKEKKLETAMNQWLVQGVIETIVTYNPIAEIFIKAVEKIPNWQSQTRYRNAGLTILQSSFIGVVGIYLKKISAISNYSFSVEKLKEYIKNTYFLSLHLLDMINSIHISTLWDFSLKQQIDLNDKNKEIVRQFFEQTVERDMKFSFDLLITLVDILKTNKIENPVPEIINLDEQIFIDSELHNAFSKIEQIYINIQKQEPNGEDSFWVEKSLTDILISFNFLAKYKIQAVKSVDYHSIRTMEEFFIHKLSFYGLSAISTEQNKIISEKIQFSTKKINF